MAEIVTTVEAVTAFVVIRNPALVAPAGTVTVAGTVVLGSLLLNVTTVPPLGAGPFRVTVFVPVTCVPPITETGYSETPDNATGFTVRLDGTVIPLYVADTVTGVVTVTDVVLITKLGDTV